MRVIGIDYSIRCPAICIFESNEATPVWYPENCQIHFLTDKKKHCYRITPNVMGHYQASYNEQNDTERFDRISDWAMGILDCVSLGGVKVGLEDYAFSAQGLVYKIGENTGMLKYKMYTNGIPFELVSNSKPKKLATGKGNADKNSVYDAFVAETGWNIHHHIKSKSGKIASPLSDIADSYWICKWLFQKNAIASESSSLPSSP